MIFLQLLDPLCVSLFVSFVLETLVARLSFALVEAMSLGVPLVAGDNARGIERGSGTYNLACEKLSINGLAIPSTYKILIFYHGT